MNALLATLDTAGIDAFKELHDALYADQPAEGGPGPDRGRRSDRGGRRGRC